MYSRVSRFNVPVDKIDLAIRTVQGRADARRKGSETLPGFAGEVLLMDREGQEAMLIVYYQDKVTLDSSAEAARQLRDQIATGLGAKTLSVNEYQVAVSDLPSGAASD